MKRLLIVLAATCLMLMTAPLALGDPVNGNKPTQYFTCPNSSYELVSASNSPSDNHNGNAYVCVKTVGTKSSEGPQYIDDTAHNQNG